MAVYSKNITGDSRYSLELTITNNDSNVTNNTSVITYIVKLKYSGSLSYGSWDNDLSSNYAVNIAGARVASGSFSYNFRNYNSLTLASGTKTLTHASDGSLVLAVSSAVNMAGKGSASVSSTYIGTPIARGVIWVGTKNGLKSGEVYIGTSSGAKKAVAVYVGTANGVKLAT